MRIEGLVFHPTHAHPRVAPPVAKAMVIISLLLLHGCTVNAPSCDGRFEPINQPAPASMDAEKEAATAARDHTS